MSQRDFRRGVPEISHLLPQRVVLLPLPLLLQERGDLLSSSNELISVPPDRVRRVGESDFRRELRIPCLSGGFHLACFVL